MKTFLKLLLCLSITASMLASAEDQRGGRDEHQQRGEYENHDRERDNHDYRYRNDCCERNSYRYPTYNPEQFYHFDIHFFFDDKPAPAPVPAPVVTPKP
jgi:hypothetical protein